MFAELVRSRLVLLVAALPPLAVVLFFALSGGNFRFRQSDSAHESSRSISVEDMKVSLARDRQQLRQLEQEQSRLRVKVIELRRSFQEGTVSREQVLSAEQAYVAA